MAGLKNSENFVDGQSIVSLCKTWESSQNIFLLQPFTHAIGSPVFRTSRFGRASEELVILYNNNNFNLKKLIIDNYYISFKAPSDDNDFISINVYFPSFYNTRYFLSYSNRQVYINLTAVLMHAELRFNNGHIIINFNK